MSAPRLPRDAAGAPRMGSFRYQSKVLTARYRDVMVGDWRALLFGFGQAGLIGWLCTLVWGQGSARDEAKLWFMMVLACVWFGAVNACREIVRERPILERERMFGLSLPAYVRSKLAVLLWIGLAQVLLFQTIVELELAVRGPFVVQTLALTAAAFAGSCLGLVASALAPSAAVAVGAIPLMVLPQILFSEFTVSKARGVVETLRDLMPAHWAYEAFKAAGRNDPDWADVIWALAVLTVYALALATAATLALRRRRDV